MIRRKPIFQGQRVKVEGRNSEVLDVGRACGAPSVRAATCRAGFSLIEMVVVMLVMSILVMLAVEHFTSLSSVNDPLAADELRVNLRYIRNLAVTRERMTRVTFSVISNSYSVAVADTNAPGSYATAVHPVTQSPWVVVVDERFPGVSLSNVDIGGGNTLYFSGTKGIPCHNTNIPLAANGTIVFNSGLIVTIAPETGYVAFSP